MVAVGNFMKSSSFSSDICLWGRPLFIMEGLPPFTRWGLIRPGVAIEDLWKLPSGRRPSVEESKSGGRPVPVGFTREVAENRTEVNFEQLPAFI